MRVRFFLIIPFFFTIISCERSLLVKDAKHSLPVVELDIDEKYLWSQDSGLYVVGDEHPNFVNTWEFPAHIKYLEDDSAYFSGNIGFRIKGNSTRNSSVKSFGLYWRGEYGKSELEYPVFVDNDISTYKRLLLRSSSNDYTHLKDAFVCSLIKGYVNVDYQDYQPCALYLNNDYWGLYYLREMITPHHFQYHYGLENDSIDLLKGVEESPTVDDGSTDDFMQDIIDYISENSLAVETNYNHISEIIDIPSYMDYIILNTYIAKVDWPIDNGKWWHARGVEPYHKWRWVFYDADWSFRYEYVDDVFIGKLYGKSFNVRGTDNFYVFDHLIDNEEFKQQFLERYMYCIDVIFEKNRVEAMLDDMQSLVHDEYIRHSQRWQKNDGFAWKISLEEIVRFNNKRNDMMRDVINKLQNED